MKTDNRNAKNDVTATPEKEMAFIESIRITNYMWN